MNAARKTTVGCLMNAAAIAASDAAIATADEFNDELPRNPQAAFIMPHGRPDRRQYNEGALSHARPHRKAA